MTPHRSRFINCRASVAGTIVAGTAMLGAAATFAPLPAHAQGLRYTLTPTASKVEWDNPLGLEDTYLYGGRLGLVFGRFVELQGHYLTNQGSTTRLADLSDRLGVGNPPPDSRLAVRKYGADIVLNFGAGAITPFARGGGSVIRFEPDNAGRSNVVALSYGGGLRFGDPSRISLNLFADQLLFRVDRARLLPGGTGGSPAEPDAEADEIRRNFAYGAGLTLPLGGGTSYEDAPAFSLANLSVPVEVFGGVVEFDDALGRDRQRLAGARAGLDFGPYVGLRGFYWRGVNEDLDDTERVQSYGGEAQFNLGAGSGFSPFLLAGAGRLDYMRGYQTTGADSGASLAMPPDRDYLILGGGVRVPLGDRLHLQVAARDMLFAGAGSDLQNVSDPDELRHNWQYSAGIGFQLGGRTPVGRSARGRDGRVDTVFVRGPARAPRTVDAEERRRMREARDERPRRMERVVEMDTIVVSARGDTLRGAQADSAMRERRMRAGAGYQSGRTMEVVVPTEGEINIRYGPQRDSSMRPMAGTPMSDEASVAAMREAMRAVIREEMSRSMMLQQSMQPQPPARAGAPVPAPAMNFALADSLERRIMARVEDVVRMRMAEQREQLRATVRDEVARQGMGPEAERRLMERVEELVAARLRDRALVPATPEQAPSATVTTRPARTSLSLENATWSAYSGLSFGGGTQLLLGGRADLGEAFASLPGFHVVPEVAFGVGSGSSVMVAANLTYEFGGFQTNVLGRIRPYAGAGLGFLNFNGGNGDRDGLDIVINPAYGASAEVRGLSAVRVGGRTPLLFVEHQGVGFFDVNRLLVGLKWRR